MSGSVLDPPAPGYERAMPFDKQLVVWVLFISALIMFGISGAWMFFGRQNNPQEYFRTDPTQFAQVVHDFADKYQVAPRTVRVPPGQDAYLVAQMWTFYPDLILKKDHKYKIWYSSVDLMHAPIIADQVLVFMSVPGHTQAVTITPTTSGKYLLYCGEYCGVGHQQMMGKLIVED
jgi:cytochrome c oxidase subunit II